MAVASAIPTELQCALKSQQTIKTTGDDNNNNATTTIDEMQATAQTEAEAKIGALCSDDSTDSGAVSNNGSSCSASTASCGADEDFLEDEEEVVSVELDDSPGHRPASRSGAAISDIKQRIVSDGQFKSMPSHGRLTKRMSRLSAGRRRSGLSVHASTVTCLCSSHLAIDLCIGSSGWTLLPEMRITDREQKDRERGSAFGGGVSDPQSIASAVSDVTDKDHYCRLCNMQLNSCNQVLMHVAGKRHKKRCIKTLNDFKNSLLHSNPPPNVQPSAFSDVYKGGCNLNNETYDTFPTSGSWPAAPSTSTNGSQQQIRPPTGQRQQMQRNSAQYLANPVNVRRAGVQQPAEVVQESAVPPQVAFYSPDVIQSMSGGTQSHSQPIYIPTFAAPSFSSDGHHLHPYHHQHQQQQHQQQQPQQQHTTLSPVILTTIPESAFESPSVSVAVAPPNSTLCQPSISSSVAQSPFASVCQLVDGPSANVIEGAAVYDLQSQCFLSPGQRYQHRQTTDSTINPPSSNVETLPFLADGLANMQLTFHPNSHFHHPQQQQQHNLNPLKQPVNFRYGYPTTHGNCSVNGQALVAIGTSEGIGPLISNATPPATAPSLIASSEVFQPPSTFGMSTGHTGDFPYYLTRPTVPSSVGRATSASGAVIASKKARRRRKSTNNTNKTVTVTTTNAATSAATASQLGSSMDAKSSTSSFSVSTSPPIKSPSSSLSSEIMCSVCHISVNSSHQLQTHIDGQRHRIRCQKERIDPLNAVFTPVTNFSNTPRSASECSVHNTESAVEQQQMSLVCNRSAQRRQSDESKQGIVAGGAASCQRWWHQQRHQAGGGHGRSCGGHGGSRPVEYYTDEDADHRAFYVVPLGGVQETTVVQEDQVETMPSLFGPPPPALLECHPISTASVGITTDVLYKRLSQ